MAEAARAIVSTLPTEEAWSAFLAAELRVPVSARFTRSRKAPVAVRPARQQRGALEVRLHRLFAEAPPEVHGAVASWVRSGRRAPRACAQLDAWIAEILRRVPPADRVSDRAALGAHHDLERMVDEILVNELAADELAAARPKVSWGRRGASRTRSSLRLGSYDPDGRLVRIHPVLDQAAVPDWFVRFVVFHELLHAVFPPVRGDDDRWVHHGREFRRRERAHVDYRRAIAWERAHLKALIRSARRGVPLDPESLRASPKAREVRKPVRTEKGVLRLLQELLFPE